VLITRARIRDISVFRACNLATRRDHVVFQHAWSFDRYLNFIGAIVGNDKTVTLDQGGVIAGLHADGDALVWTHDGAPRRIT
jgi:hypothetical protein